MKKILTAGAILLVLIVAGGAIGVWQMRPQARVSRALQKISARTSGHYSAHLTIDNLAATQQLLGQPASLELVAAGDYDRSPGARSALRSDIEVFAKTETVTVKLTGQARLIGDKAYLLLHQIPPSLAALAPIKGQWLELERGEAAGEAALSSADTLHLQNVLYAGSEQVDGRSTAKFSATAAPEASVRMFDGLAAVLGARLTADQVDNLRSTFSSAGDVPVELWLSPWGDEIRQLQTRVAAPNGNTLLLTLKLDDAKPSQALTAPDNARNLAEILKPSPAVP